MGLNVPGTEGYEAEAERLLSEYEQFSFEDIHQPVLHFIPEVPNKVLDIGAGTGRDAAYLAGQGHPVIAVEPTNALRRGAALLHPSSLITWVDDSLPELTRVLQLDEQFDLILLSAVWMHLDAGQRLRAMPKIASLLNSAGVLILSLRHGPVPAGRVMFAVSVAETLRLANAEQLKSVYQGHANSRQDLNQRKGVTWTQMGFEKG